MNRLLALLAGFVSYCVAALAAATAVLVLMSLHEGGSNLPGLTALLPAAAIIVATYAFLPFLLAIALLNGLGRVGWLAHTIAGAAVSLAALLLMTPRSLIRPSDLVANWSIVAGGGVAGFTAWVTHRILLPQDNGTLDELYLRWFPVGFY